jgi:hypothetical protein
MSEHNADYAEDKQILSRLGDAVDIEAFSNLMRHAHGHGMSAADFIREEPKRTSRKMIRKLCLKNRKQRLRLQISSLIQNFWGRPGLDPEGSMRHIPFRKFSKNGHNGVIRD